MNATHLREAHEEDALQAPPALLGQHAHQSAQQHRGAGQPLGAAGVTRGQRRPVPVVEEGEPREALGVRGREQEHKAPWPCAGVYFCV